MNDPTPINDELAEALRAYLALQEEERGIRERKTALQEQLAAHMKTMGAAEWMPEVDGRRLKVRYRRSTRITYDEACLSERLGERYRRILRPDIRKMRRHLEDVEPYLAELMDVIGSPDPGKVKEAIEAGLVTAGEFRGAFEKKDVEQLSVFRLGAGRQPEPEA